MGVCGRRQARLSGTECVGSLGASLSKPHITYGNLCVHCRQNIPKEGLDSFSFLGHWVGHANAHKRCWREDPQGQWLFSSLPPDTQYISRAVMYPVSSQGPQFSPSEPLTK